MITLQQLQRRRLWATRLSRWTALLFFVLGTSVYAIDSDLAQFLLPVRSISVFSLLIAGVLYLIQFLEVRREHGGIPMVLLTGMVLSFLLGGIVYTREFAAYREAEFSFEHEGVTLEGTLYLPPEPGQYPAVVIAQGSMKAPRRLYHVWADMLVRNGIAVLNFDKRGTGSSGGVYESENNSSGEYLRLLAGDVATGIHHLRTHPEVDSTAVGVFGLSMGGWLGVLVAVDVPETAFMVFVSGPTVSVREEHLFSDLMGERRKEGRGIPVDSVNALVMSEVPGGFDPRPLLRRMTIPSVWLFGDNDLSIPVPKCTGVLDSLILFDRRPFRYHVYDGANHLLVLPAWPFDFPPTLRGDIAAFIKGQVGPGGMSSHEKVID